VLEELQAQQADTTRQRERQRQRLKQLEAESLKLLQAHYADAIPLDLLKAEQQRIAEEKIAVRAALEVTVASAEHLKATAHAAVTLATNCYRSYLDAPNRERRIMNQAFFHAIWVTEEGVVGWEYNEPFATLLRAHRAREPRLTVEYQPTTRTRADDAFEVSTAQTLYRRSPGRWARAVFCQGSKANNLAEGVGFEPTVGVSPQRFSRPSDSATLASLQVAY
jgi:site-specific DNA recombinase